MLYTTPVRCSGQPLTVTQDDEPCVIYADPELTTPLPNPLPSDAAGRLPPIYVPAGEYQIDGSEGAQTVSPEILPLSTTSNSYEDENGDALAFATRTFYEARTSKLAVIEDGEGGDLANPQTANEDGEFPETHLDDAKQYRVVLKDSAGNLVYAHEVRILVAPPPAGPFTILVGEFPEVDPVSFGYNGPGLWGSIVSTSGEYTLRHAYRRPGTNELFVSLFGSDLPQDLFETVTFSDGVGSFNSADVQTFTSLGGYAEWQWNTDTGADGLWPTGQNRTVTFT